MYRLRIPIKRQFQTGLKERKKKTQLPAALKKTLFKYKYAGR